MRIEGATPDQIAYVARHMRARDRAEFMPLSPARSHIELCELLVQNYGSRLDVIAACDGNEPVAIGGLIQHRPNVATLLMYATDRFPAIAHPLTRFIRKCLFPAGRETGVHRIEATSIAGYDEAHRWIEMLGLQREAELPGYGRGGETYISFAWVRPDLACPARMLMSASSDGRTGLERTNVP